MKKFVTVFMGSRGILEEVNLVESKLSCSDYCDSVTHDLIAELKNECEDEEDFDFMIEFLGVEDYGEFKVVGLNEEEHLIVFDFEVSKDLCEKLLEFWENGDEDGIRDIIDSLDY